MNEVRPRRKSVFGGLLWIILGVLLLANNLGARFGILELLGNWWPLILILLGLGKLFEHYAATRSGDAPARLLSGGEVFLLIVLFLMAGAYSGLVKFGNENDLDINFPWWDSYSFTEEAVSKGVKPNARITVNVARGNLTVIPEDGGEIRVVANMTIRAANESEGRSLTSDYGVAIQESAGAYEIRAKSGLASGVDNTGGGRGEPRFRRLGRLDLEIHVPRQSVLDLRTERGGIHVNGLTGNVTTSSRGGDVEIRDVAGNVEVDLRSGDIRVINTKGDVKVSGRGGEVEVTDVAGLATVNGEYGGPVRFKNIAKEARYNSRRTDLVLSTLKGSAELNSGDMEIFEAGNATINTSSYDIKLENVMGRILVDNKNGGVDVRFSTPPKDDIEVNNERADIHVTLPEKSEFTVDASSRRGPAESEFKDGIRVSEDRNDGKIEGKVGARGPNIKLRTTHGAVGLRKGN